jgi:hypothetical protein
MRSTLLVLVSVLSFCQAVFAQTDPNAKINLELVAPKTPVGVGDIVEISLKASANTTPQRYLVSDIIFGWDNTKLEFLDVNHSGSHPFIWVPPSGLPCPAHVTPCEGIGGDYTGINEEIPPVDGNALYYGYGQLGQVFIITEPVEIVKFIFRVKAPFTTSEITLIPELTITYQAKTVIYGSYIPGMPVTGTLTNATVFGKPLLGDINGDSLVNSFDMAAVLSAWGQLGFADNPCDINGDGTVNSQDMAIVLNNWS